MAGWLKLNCAIQTDSVKIQNVKIDVYPDATIGCIKHYLLAEIIKSGHQFVMRNFDDLRIVLVNEADLYESDKRDGTLMICSWSASSECDYDRITQTAQFRRSRKASGGDWEVSLLICPKSHAEAQEEAKKEQEEAKNRSEEQATKKQAARRRARARKKTSKQQEDEQVFRIRTPSPCEGVRMAPPGKLLTVDDMVSDLLKQCDLLKQSQPDTFTVMQWKDHIAKKHEDHSYHAAMEEYERIKAMMMNLTKMGFLREAAESDKQRHELPVASHQPHKQRHKLCNVPLPKRSPQVCRESVM